MGRRAVSIERDELQREITKLERKQKFTNRNALYEAILTTAWAKALATPASVSVLASRVREWDLKIKTPLGKKGRPAGTSIKRTSRKEKFSANAELRQSVRAVKGVFQIFEGTKFNSLLNKFAAGSMKAAVGLKCIDCCGGQQEEVKRCEIVECPLWNFRPWKLPLTQGIAA